MVRTRRDQKLRRKGSELRGELGRDALYSGTIGKRQDNFVEHDFRNSSTELRSGENRQPRSLESLGRCDCRLSAEYAWLRVSGLSSLPPPHDRRECSDPADFAEAKLGPGASRGSP